MRQNFPSKEAAANIEVRGVATWTSMLAAASFEGNSTSFLAFPLMLGVIRNQIVVVFVNYEVSGTGIHVYPIFNAQWRQALLQQQQQPL
jgi:hypothetical protein